MRRLFNLFFVLTIATSCVAQSPASRSWVRFVPISGSSVPSITGTVYYDQVLDRLQIFRSGIANDIITVNSPNSSEDGHFIRWNNSSAEFELYNPISISPGQVGFGSSLGMIIGSPSFVFNDAPNYKTFTTGDNNVNNGYYGSAMVGELSEIDVNVGAAFSACELGYIGAYGGTAFGRGVAIRPGGTYSQIGGWYSPGGLPGKTNLKAPQISAPASFGFYETDASQVDNHGVNARRSAALGGLNHNIPATSPGSVVLAGTIKARADDPDQVYAYNFNIENTPERVDTATQVCVRDFYTGQIYYRHASTLGGGGGGGGSVTSVNVTSAYDAITATGGPITSNGSITLGVSPIVESIADLTTAGFVVKTSSIATTTRALVGSNGIEILNGNGVGGSPTIRINHLGFQNLSNPGAYRIPFFDSSLSGGTGLFNWLSFGSGLGISGTNLVLDYKTTGDLSLGSTSISGDREILAESSDVDADIIITPQGAGSMFTTYDTDKLMRHDGLVDPIIFTGTTLLLTESHRARAIVFTNASGCTVTLSTGFPVGWNCLLIEGPSAGAVTVTTSGTTVSGKTTTTEDIDRISLMSYQSNTYLGL